MSEPACHHVTSGEGTGFCPTAERLARERDEALEVITKAADELWLTSDRHAYEARQLLLAALKAAGEHSDQGGETP